MAVCCLPRRENTNSWNALQMFFVCFCGNEKERGNTAITVSKYYYYKYQQTMN